MYELLIADDEFEIRNGLSHYFPWEENGFRVAGQAENGLEALQFISRRHVDVLLCDVRMPVMSGIDVARELHAQNSPIQLVFISGYREFDYVHQAMRYGVKNYILKPTKYHELVKVFAQLKKELDEKRDRTAGSAGHAEDAGGAGTVAAAESFDPAEPISQKIIRQIKQYVEEHYRDVTLESVSEVVHMNPYYISKYFKQKTGENFSDYCIRVKMEKAAELLRNPLYKTYEISELVGYSNAKNFARTFKKYFGTSPREFRERR